MSISFYADCRMALGLPGVIEIGAIFEFRVGKKPGSAQLDPVG
jgi:hypothetical protein